MILLIKEVKNVRPQVECTLSCGSGDSHRSVGVMTTSFDFLKKFTTFESVNCRVCKTELAKRYWLTARSAHLQPLSLFLWAECTWRIMMSPEVQRTLKSNSKRLRVPVLSMLPQVRYLTLLLFFHISYSLKAYRREESPVAVGYNVLPRIPTAQRVDPIDRTGRERQPGAEPLESKPSHCCLVVGREDGINGAQVDERVSLRVGRGTFPLPVTDNSVSESIN